MKKINYPLLLAIFSLSFFTNCGSDDSSDTQNPSETLEQEREATTTTLTANNNGVWRIEQANLVNSSGTFNISNNFNVVDDEFIFSGTAQAGMLQWRQGNAINIEATSAQETLLDYYKSPENSSFLFIGDTNNELNSFDGTFKYIVIDSETVNLTITYDNAERLLLTLVQKLPGDYMSAPSSTLNFTEAFIYESNMVSCCAPGMIGSYSDNSLFIVNREDDFTDPNNPPQPERIVKFNLDTGTTEENLLYNTDFVSKQLHIINNELVVLGAEYVNTYPLDFSSDPVSIQHGLKLTRFGMAISDDDAYMIGGDLNDDPNTGLPIDAEKIYKWNLVTESLEFVTDLPEDRFGARSTIVNDKLYVFGGHEDFSSTLPNPNNSIYIYDLSNGTISTETMTTSAKYTYVDKVQNLIYVSGYFDIADTNGDIIDRDFFIGVYNTNNNTYQELTHNLSQDSYNAIHGMCIFNNKIYVIYGTLDNDPQQAGQWSIMAADLN